ncbi:M20 family metallo-hydrolase [Cyclobacteriaceae bacterium]|nr:M20 family metallo-hydrolase [Cyclobacteriaceae bacterium]
MIAIDELFDKAVKLLSDLIATQSYSKEEAPTADIIEKFFVENNVKPNRLQNNVWASNVYFDEEKPTILLNSHHDTVKPNKGYTRDPFAPTQEDGKLFGLGSNDAGGCLVSLIMTFLHFYDNKDLNYNIVLAATAEEEISGKGGIELLFPHLPKIDFGIIGEPTLMDAAVAEKGLMVLDGIVTGKAGHAAREEGDNAIYKTMKDVAWFSSYKYPEVSDFLGEMKMSLTVINAGKQHNVVPAECSYVVDVRLTDKYSHEETLAIIQANTIGEVIPRSTRIKPSFIAKDHPVVISAIKNGAKTYGSPTTSDQALIPCTTLKMGPGDSARSHSPDEFIYVNEIKEGIEKYITIINELM